MMGVYKRVVNRALWGMDIQLILGVYFECISILPPFFLWANIRQPMKSHLVKTPEHLHVSLSRIELDPRCFLKMVDKTLDWCIHMYFYSLWPI